MLNDTSHAGSGTNAELDGVYPLYPVAVIVPILAFPATILCIPPMMWHFAQRNIAAGSLMLWLIFLNFPNAINPLIWPRDNTNDWWDGQGFCDIQTRLQVGAVIALPSCAGVVARRLANVMDTGNITVAPSRNRRVLERCIDVVFCWVLPVMLMIIYYIVQPMRYFLYGISGCVAVYDRSWPSIVLIYIWAPIAAIVASYYAVLLICRLYRYRREFHRLLAARNTTKSRFIRLFLMSIIFLVVVVPYDIYILYYLVHMTSMDYQWSRVHGKDWNSIIKVPSQGTLRFDRWAEMAFGYILFFLFGTGTDANNSYKRMLVSIGLGSIFPSLYNMKDSASNTPSRVSFVKGWPTSWSTKAKGVFSKSGTVDGTLVSRTDNTASVAGSPNTAQSENLQPVSTREPILPNRPESTKKTFFSRVFGRSNKVRPTLLPISTGGSEELTQTGKSPADSIPPGVHARAWSNEGSTNQMEGDGVQVVHEIRQAHEKKGKGVKRDPLDWA